jgi:hypothetical protein
MLAPPAEMRSSIASCAPVPSAAMLMTAATPMIMPSIVRSVRMRFERSALSPTMKATPRFMTQLYREPDDLTCHNRSRYSLA